MASPPSLSQLWLASLQLGTVAFGGIGATLALLKRDFVERKGWLNDADLSEALAYTKPLPGSTVVQIITFLGWRLRRWPGAVLATIAFLTPAIALMTMAAAFTYVLPDIRVVRGALAGLQAAVIGLLVAALWQLARREAASPVLAAVLVLAFTAGLFTNAAVIVMGAGLVGVIVHRWHKDA